MMEDDPLINKKSEILNETQDARRSPDYYGESESNTQVDVIGKHDTKQVMFLHGPRIERLH